MFKYLYYLLDFWYTNILSNVKIILTNYGAVLFNMPYNNLGDRLCLKLNRLFWE